MQENNRHYRCQHRHQVDEYRSSAGSNHGEKNNKKSLSLWISKNKKILSVEKRAENDAKKFLTHLLSKELDKSGIPQGIKSDVKKGFKISVGDSSNKSIKTQLLELISTDATIFSSD